MTSVQKGNSAGLIAITLWSTLALFTISTGAIPPFQLTFMTFSIAFVIGLIAWIVRGADARMFTHLPKRVWLIGVYGLFGYHFFYFLALKSAPALEANLINYLWPLLIVLLSAALPNERLRWFHSVGALCGFIGAFLLIGGKGISFSLDYMQGYVYAVVCAFVWSSYSVASRYFGSVPTLAVGAFCGVTAVLSFGAHLVFEQTYVPSMGEMAYVMGMGIGPMGIAFFVWDYAMKQGDIKFVGSLSYATPLLSTLLLILFGGVSASETIWLSCGLIVVGSALSSLGLRR